MQVAVGVPVTTGTTEEGIETLRARGFPPGLVSSVQKSVDAYPCRFWIIDNSGSMNHSDGKRLIQSGTKLVSIGSTRWAEIGDTVMVSRSDSLSCVCQTHILSTHPFVFSRNRCLPRSLPRSAREQTTCC